MPYIERKDEQEQKLIEIRTHYEGIRERFYLNFPALLASTDLIEEEIDSLLCRIENAEVRNALDLLIGKLEVAHEVSGYEVSMLEQEELTRYRAIISDFAESARVFAPVQVKNSALTGQTLCANMVT